MINPFDDLKQDKEGREQREKTRETEEAEPFKKKYESLEIEIKKYDKIITGVLRQLYGAIYPGQISYPKCDYPFRDSLPFHNPVQYYKRRLEYNPTWRLHCYYKGEPQYITVRMKLLDGKPHFFSCFVEDSSKVLKSREFRAELSSESLVKAIKESVKNFV